MSKTNPASWATLQAAKQMTHQASEVVFTSLKQTDDQDRTYITLKDLLALPWELYRNLSEMEHLEPVDYIKEDPSSPYSPIYWLMTELSMKNTIMLWSSIITGLIATHLATTESPLLSTSSAFATIIGVLAWSAVEYLYHRFIGHMPVINKTTQHIQLIAHGKHHFAPNDMSHVFLSPATVAIPAFAIYHSLLKNMTNEPMLAMAAALTHYLIFDVMHWMMHTYSTNEVRQWPLIGKPAAKIWSHHHVHHLRPSKNFPVTTANFFPHIVASIPKMLAAKPITPQEEPSELALKNR